MAQITIYLDDAAASRLKSAAKAEGKSVSKWIAGIVDEKTADRWSPEVLALAGTWGDDDFPTLEEIRANDRPNLKREKW